MSRTKSAYEVLLKGAVLWFLVGGHGAQAGIVSPDLERAMARRGTHADTSVIVRFVNPLDSGPFVVTDRRERNNQLMLALKERAQFNRASIEPMLTSQGATHVKDLWVINAVAVTLPAFAVKQLASQSGIARIDLDSFVQGGRSQRIPVLPNSPVNGDPIPQEDSLPISTKDVKSSWNIDSIHASAVWTLGHTGRGIVVASMDTGVDLAHPDLRRKWRGGTNSWFDPHKEQSSPYDALGHGTQTMGLIAGSPEIGVAPDVRWIAARLYNREGRASMSDIHLVFQWMLDPDGDPSTVDSPDVVNASWALTGRGKGACIVEFNDDIRVLKSSGIAIVFAAGNDGPFPNTSNSPGNNPGVMSVGAMDADLDLARQTSRGPSACDATEFPRLWAPGVNVRTADLSYGGQLSYTTVSGSSFAAPHAAGVLALLAGAFPWASVAELEMALTAVPKDEKRHLTGRVDALSAFNYLRGKRDITANVPPARSVAR
jgi:serine protease AprX